MLTLFKKTQLEAYKGESFEDIANRMMCESIRNFDSYYDPDPEERNENDQKIMDMYLENLVIFGGVVDLDEILSDIIAFNEELIKEIADIKYEMEGYPESPNLAADEAKERIYETLDEFYMYNYPEFANLDGYIFDLLVKNRAFFEIPINYAAHQVLTGGDISIRVGVNDCQTVPFPLFRSGAFSEVEDYEDVDILNVWSD